MFRFKTTRRRLLLGFGSVLVLSGLSLAVVHTSLVRRFVLVQAQIHLGNATGLVLDAKDLRYNLFRGWFELRDVQLKGTQAAALPAPLTATRIELVLPVWRLIRGSFDTARIRIDGMSLHWFTGQDGQTNWPTIKGGGGSGSSGGPAVLVTSGTFYLQDDRNGILMQIPVERLLGTWDAAASKYAIACEAASGSLQWQGKRLPLERLELKSALMKGKLSLESLRLRSGKSDLAVAGSLSGSPARVDAIADLNLDLREVSRALPDGPSILGRLRAHIVAAGPLDALKIKASVAGEDLSIRGTPIVHPVAEIWFDTGTGEVQVQDLSSGFLGGHVAVNGRVRLRVNSGHSELSASLTDLDPAKAARLFGTASILPGRTSVAFHASCPGLDWRLATISGVAHARSLKVVFEATGRAGSVVGSFDSKWPGVAEVHGDVGFSLADQALNGVVHGSVKSLAQFGNRIEDVLRYPVGSLGIPAIDGSARWSATLGGTTGLPAVALQLDGKGLSARGWAGADLQLRADYMSGRVGITDARLTWQGQQIQAHGELGGVTPDAPLKLDGTMEVRSLAKVFGGLGIDTPVEAAVSGGFRVSGTLAHPAAETTLQTNGLTAYGERFSQLSLNARWQDGEIALSSLVAEQDHETGTKGHFEASGGLNLATGTYAIEAAGRDLRPTAVVLPGGYPLTGSFQIEAHGKGNLSDPVLSARLNGTGVKVGDTSVDRLEGEIEAGDHHATVVLEAPTLNTQVTSEIAMAGAWPFAVNIEARNARFDTPLAASIAGAVHANGTLAPPQLERAAISVDVLQISAGGQDITNDGPIELSYADRRIRVGKLALKSGTSALRLDGELPIQHSESPGTLSLQGRVGLESLSQFLPHTGDSPITGVAEVKAAITGSVQEWRPAGTVSIHDAGLDWRTVPLPVRNINGTLTLSDGVIRVDRMTGTAGTGNLQIDGSLPLHMLSDSVPPPGVDGGQPARFSARLDQLELSGGSGDQAVTVKAAAKLEGETPGLSLSLLRANLEFSELEANGKDSHLKQSGPTRVAIAGGVARLEHLEIGGPDATLRASGAMGLTEGFPIQLEASGKTNLGFLSLVAAPLETSGAVQLDLRVGGTLSAPQTTGFIELDKASLILPNPRLQAGNIKLRADLNGEQVTVKELSGNLNGGAFTGGGELKLGTEGLRDVNLFLKGKDIFTEYPFAAKTTSTLDMKFLSRQNRLVLTGQIDIQDGYYDAAIDLFSGSNQSLKTLEGPPDAASTPVVLDIQIKTKRPVEMDNNLGRLAATADLRLAGTVRTVGLLGSMELEEDGKLYFGDRTYYIERGTVRFRDESRVTPDLDIQAYTRTGDYTIRLGLSGHADELTTTFTSDPPLSRDDVIAVLLTGKTVAENRGVDLRALEATSLATGALNASLSSKLNRSIGVSRVSIQPGAVAAESNPGARITVTQDFTSSLRLLYSMNLSDSNDQIWVGEYDLSRRFTTRAVKQSDNTYRGEFRHDIRFGKSSSAAGRTAVRGPARKISEVQFAGTGPFGPEALAKVFKVKAGQKYKPIKVRKASVRLGKFLKGKGYLESRVRLDREDKGQDLLLTVRVELGPTVELSFHGANLSKKQKSRVRNVWHAGISDQQRPQVSKEAMLGYLAQKGFLQAQADVHVTGDDSHKAVRFDLRPGTHYHGVKVVLEGAEPAHANQILSMIGGRPLRTSLYRAPDRVVEAIGGYYQQRGYLAAKVAVPLQHLDSERRTGQVVISIVEGPVFHVGDLHFSGNHALTAEDLGSGVPLTPGVPFEPARIDPTVAALKQKYGKLGYREARVAFSLQRHDDPALVDVSFTVAENKQTSVGKISVAGNLHTTDKFALRRIRIAEGGVANSELIRESVKNLSQTGAYTSADLQVRPPEANGTDDKLVQVSDVVVAVAEPKPFRLLYGGLYDTGNGPGFIADFQNHNTLGAGQVLGLRARVDSETDEARLYLTRPFWGMHRLSTTLATYFTREVEYHQTTPTEKLGVSIQQDLQLRSKWLLSYGYRFEKQRGFVPDPAAPDIPQTVVLVSPLTLTVSRDARDSFLDATRGSFVSHGFEYAPRALGSDYPYFRYYVQYSKYFALTQPKPVPFGEKEQRSRLVFATGSRLGLQKGFSAEGAVLTDRFFAGGGTTVRGFRQDELGPKLANGEPAGGNAVLVLNEELRYPLFWIFDAATFVDIGNVYPRVSDFKIKELRTAGGFGLRIRNPFVVLRFDYGFKFDRRPGEKLGAFFFSIGQAF